MYFKIISSIFFEMLKRATLCYIMTYKDFTFHFFEIFAFLRAENRLKTAHILNECAFG